MHEFVYTPITDLLQLLNDRQTQSVPRQIDIETCTIQHIQSCNPKFPAPFVSRAGSACMIPSTGKSTNFIQRPSFCDAGFGTSPPKIETRNSFRVEPPLEQLLFSISMDLHALLICRNLVWGFKPCDFYS